MSARGEGRPREAWERFVTVTVTVPRENKFDKFGVGALSLVARKKTASRVWPHLERVGCK